METLDYSSVHQRQEELATQISTLERFLREEGVFEELVRYLDKFSYDNNQYSNFETVALNILKDWMKQGKNPNHTCAFIVLLESMQEWKIIEKTFAILGQA